MLEQLSPYVIDTPLRCISIIQWSNILHVTARKGNRLVDSQHLSHMILPPLPRSFVSLCSFTQSLRIVEFLPHCFPPCKQALTFTLLTSRWHYSVKSTPIQAQFSSLKATSFSLVWIDSRPTSNEGSNMIHQGPDDLQGYQNVGPARTLHRGLIASRTESIFNTWWMQHDDLLTIRDKP